jgi:single-strand DNA-binding protein
MSDETDARPQAAEPKRGSGPSVNKVILLGRLTADPEMRFTNDGKPVTRMRLATNWQDQAEYHTLVTFGSQAQFAGEYLTKGRLIYAEGRLHTNDWTAEDGSKRRATEVIASNVQALGSRAQRDETQRAAEQEAER